MRWINSGGGPFLLLASCWLDHWRGVDGDDWADYDRACAVKHEIGRVDVGPGAALVVRSETQNATWAAPRGTMPGLIVDWGAARSARRMEAVVRQAPDDLFRRQRFRFRVETRQHFLFDSAYSGSRLRETDHLRINLQPGDYDVLSARHRADEETYAVLHRLVRRPDPC